MNLGRQQIVALGNAKRGVMLPKDRVDLLGEPRFVTELERDHGSIGCPKRRNSKEAAEPLGISLEVGWKLEEKEAKLARLSHRLDFSGSYTLATATSNIGSSSDETDANLVQDVSNPFGPVQDAPSTRTDARHRVSLSAIVEGPAGLNIAPIFL
jgi:hypothetical protein